MRTKPLLLLLCLSTVLTANAKIWTVSVSNYQFNPANLNVNVGDTIKWNYVNGFHTTTSTSVPQGANTWDAPMQKAGDTYQYIIAVAGTYDYVCSIHPQMIGTINASGALPVKLASFSVTPSKNAAIALISWTTATEINTDWFIVKKSTDGSTFSEISRVKATGNSSIPKTYSVEDNNVGSSFRYIYYMLAIMDKSGSTAYSPVARFTNNNAAQKLITQISPNPVSSPGHLMIQFNAEKEDDMLVQLYDVNGKLIKEVTMHAEQGLNNGHFHMGDVPSGVYNIVFSMEGLRENYRIVMQ